MDNVRNMTGSPIAGIDPHELLDIRPLNYGEHLLALPCSPRLSMLPLQPSSKRSTDQPLVVYVPHLALTHKACEGCATRAQSRGHCKHLGPEKVRQRLGGIVCDCQSPYSRCVMTRALQGGFMQHNVNERSCSSCYSVV